MRTLAKIMTSYSKSQIPIWWKAFLFTPYEAIFLLFSYASLILFTKSLFGSSSLKLELILLKSQTIPGMREVLCHAT